MGVKDTRVIVICDEYWFIAKMATGGKRVLDVLQEAHTDYLQLNDVQVFRNETQVASLPEGVVPKEKFSLILLPEKAHEAPSRRSYLLAEKKVFQACAVVPGYLVQGKLHSTRLDNSFVTLTCTLDDYFPITEATVTGAGIQRFEAPVAIVNKSVVGFLYAGETAGNALKKHPADSTGWQSSETGNSREVELVRSLQDIAAADRSAETSPAQPVLPRVGSMDAPLACADWLFGPE